MTDLKVALSNGVAMVTFNRPDKRNSLTDEMIDSYVEILNRAQYDDGIRVIVVTGAGSAFCSGGDVSKMAQVQDHSPAPAPPVGISARRHLQAGIQRIPLALEALDKPVIAAVNGAAVGAGMDLALMCDIRFVGESARFSEGYIRAGMVPGDGGCYFLPRLVGIGKALELLLGGEFIDAHEALRLGIANRLYPDAVLLDKTLEFADLLASSPPVHVQLTKRNVYASSASSLRTSLELAASHMGIVRSLKDSQEALAALRENRTGTYTGN